MWNILFFLWLISAFLYYRRRNKRLRETVVSMLSYAALERSNNPYIESVVEPCFSKNQKGILAMWVWLERKSWKRAEATERNIPKLKAELVCICVREMKIRNKKCKKCKSPIQKCFWICRTSHQKFFFLYFRDRLRNREGNKLKKRRKYMRKSN